MSVTITETTPPREAGAARPASSAPDEPQGAEFAQLFSQTLPTLQTTTAPGLPASPTPGGEETAATTATPADAADDTDVLNLLDLLPEARLPDPSAAAPPLPMTGPTAIPAAPSLLVTHDSPPALDVSTAITSGMHWQILDDRGLDDNGAAGRALATTADNVTPPGRPGLDARISVVAVQAAALADSLEGGQAEAPADLADSRIDDLLPVGRDPGLPLSRTPPAATLSGTEPSAPQLQTRGEEARELATRMGEAIGRRLIAEIARGNWQVKLNLNPATLGQIEVSMQMRDGELDASFVAAQSMTRDLLSEGMGRLRETLGSMGMNIANLTVADGHGFQHGGGSTPRPPAHWQQAPTEPAEVAPLEAASARLPASSHGLDVIV